ncbi:MAG: hypothetical protein WD826_07260 [Actinomycetota bacterium]
MIATFERSHRLGKLIELLSSDVDYRSISVYDVGRSDLGKFAFVFVGSLLG